MIWMTMHHPYFDIVAASSSASPASESCREHDVISRAVRHSYSDACVQERVDGVLALSRDKR